MDCFLLSTYMTSSSWLLTPKLCSHIYTRQPHCLKSLGFIIHEGKSLFAPSQRVALLGFVLDSNTMTISMKSDKAVKVKTAIGQLLRKEQPQIREVASIVGLVVSCFPGVK